MTLIQLSVDDLDQIGEDDWVYVEEHDRCYQGTITPHRVFKDDFYILYVNDRLDGTHDVSIDYYRLSVEDGTVKIYRKASNTTDFILD